MNKPLISFDYAIKYLLKNKGDYDIIEGFISALFATEGYPPVKINALLDSESNKESAELKKSIADLVVEDLEGNKYIVEIERAYTANFVHKACFNSSRSVVDSIYGNQDYTTIKKVFHISLLYFTTAQINKPIYHSKTITHEIDTAHPMDVKIANQGLVMFNAHNVFPEYFFISVPAFNDVINQEFDEWLYVAKYSDTKANFKSPYMQEVAERLKVLKLSDVERNEYNSYLKEMVHKQDTLSSAEAKGKAEGKAEGKVEGKAEGKAEEKIAIAKKLIADGLALEKVAAFTDLAVEQLKNL